MDLFIAAISGKPLPNLDPDAVGQVAVALSAMMKAKLTRRGGDDDGDDSKQNDDEPESFIDASFAVMCDVTRYAQLHLAEIKKSDLLTGALYQEEHSMIRFSTLCPLLPNCSRFFVSLQAVDGKESEGILCSEKLIKYLSKINEDESSSVQTITFGVDPDIKVDVK